MGCPIEIASGPPQSPSHLLILGPFRSRGRLYLSSRLLECSRSSHERTGPLLSGPVYSTPVPPGFLVPRHPSPRRPLVFSHWPVRSASHPIPSHPHT